MSEPSNDTTETAKQAKPVSLWVDLLPLIGLAVFLAGLYLTLRLAAGRVYAYEGYHVESEEGSECDDCGITLLLDNIGWLALAVAAYLLVAWFTWRVFSTCVRR